MRLDNFKFVQPGQFRCGTTPRKIVSVTAQPTPANATGVTFVPSKGRLDIRLANKKSQGRPVTAGIFTWTDTEIEFSWNRFSSFDASTALNELNGWLAVGVYRVALDDGSSLCLVPPALEATARATIGPFDLLAASAPVRQEGAVGLRVEVLSGGAWETTHDQQQVVEGRMAGVPLRIAIAKGNCVVEELCPDCQTLVTKRRQLAESRALMETLTGRQQKIESGTIAALEREVAALEAKVTNTRRPSLDGAIAIHIIGPYGQRDLCVLKVELQR